MNICIDENTVIEHALHLLNLENVNENIIK